MQPMPVGIEHIDETPRPGKLRELVSKLLFAAGGYYFIYTYAIDATPQWGMQTVDNVGWARLWWFIGVGGTVGFVILYWASNIFTMLLYFLRSSLRGGFANGAGMGAVVAVVWMVCEWITWINQGNTLRDAAEDMDWLIRHILLIPLTVGVGGGCGILAGKIPLAIRKRGEAVARAIVFGFVAFEITFLIIPLVFEFVTPLLGEPGSAYYVVLVLSVTVPYFVAGVVYLRAPRERGGARAGFMAGLFFVVVAGVHIGIFQFNLLSDKLLMLVILPTAIASTTFSGATVKKWKKQQNKQNSVLQIDNREAEK